MGWLSSEIYYKRVKIYKNTLFGKKVKIGYQLTKPLRYKYKEDIFFILNTDYVWDGPSYPNIIQFLVGKKTLQGVLAASALHDTYQRIPTRYVSKDPNSNSKKLRYTKMSIPKSAQFYKHLLDNWPNKEQTTSNLQSTIKMYFLKLLHPFYNLIFTNDNWKLLEEEI